MERDWIVFDESSDRQTTGLLYASLSPKGLILINAHTYDAMDRPEAVTLMFEPKNDEIGLESASPLMPNAFPLRKTGRSGHHLIFASRFAKKHEIKIDSTVGFY